MDNYEIAQKIIEINNFKELNPPQKQTINYIGENLIVCTPTASGKTTIFEMFLIDCLINKRKKAIYVSPLKALTSEHYHDIKKKFEKEFNCKVGYSTGDLDASVKHLENYDILFLTYEKFDSVVRHKPNWLKEVGLIGIDEIHEIGNDRGATLEIVITQIKQNYKNIKILGLSATIGNAKQLAEWLDAKLIESNYRPVPLKIGVFYDNKIYFEDEQITLSDAKNSDIGIVIKDTLKKQKQIIIFCNSRKNTMSFAQKYSKIVKEHLSEKEIEKLRKIAEDAGNALEQPTQQCLELYNDLLSGVAFHHAGLVHTQRKIVEEEFKNKNIKVIFATPTLAAGINLPAFRVLIHTVFRYENYGMVPIPINEFFQMSGRAGRPKYDDRGEAIVGVNRESDIQKIFNTYIYSGPTDIESQLAKINLLRTQLLSIILINELKTIEDIQKFISKTFYYHIFGNTKEIRENIYEIINEFKEFGFLEIKENNNIQITKLGEQICYLYIDPLSAYNIIQDLNIKNSKKQLTEKDLIYTILNTTEMAPYLHYKQDTEDELFSTLEDIKQNIFFDYEDLYLLSKINEAEMLNEWISETQENKLIEKFNTTPGQIRDIILKAEWICHCIIEIAKFTQTKNLKLIYDFKKIDTRLKYGIKEELIPLVQLKGIGRIRARKLYNAGIKNIGDISKNPEKIVTILGKIGIEILKELKIDYQKEGTQKTF